jgi:hypothetical protein
MDGEPPIKDPVLVLNGDKDSDITDGFSTVVNNVCFPNMVIY